LRGILVFYRKKDGSRRRRKRGERWRDEGFSILFWDPWREEERGEAVKGGEYCTKRGMKTHEEKRVRYQRQNTLLFVSIQTRSESMNVLLHA
jgi:hypothetical protein